LLKIEKNDKKINNWQKISEKEKFAKNYKKLQKIFFFYKRLSLSGFLFLKFFSKQNL